jgi:hypothetical protein
MSSPANTKALPLTRPQCAAALGVTDKQLRKMIHDGAPTVRRGHRGRNGSTLLDPIAINSWLADAGNRAAAEHRKVVDAMIREVATWHELKFRSESGPHKLALAGNIVESFVATATIIRSQFGLPPLAPEAYPEFIRRLIKIAPQKGD